MAIVVDASIVVKWFISDEDNQRAKHVLRRLEDEGAYAPALLRWEVANVLLAAERAGRIDEGDVDAALDVIRDLPIALEPEGSRVFAATDVRLARHYDLTPYDAAYLALASSRHIALATVDDALAYAARDLGVIVIP